ERHFLPCPRAGEIARRVLGSKVAPALERTARLPVGAHHHRVEDEPAAADALGVGKRPDIDQTLTALHAALDDPVERAAVEQFVDALGHHARGVELFDRLAGAPFLLELFGDPVLEILDAFAADAELYQMQSH